MPDGFEDGRPRAAVRGRSSDGPRHPTFADAVTRIPGVPLSQATHALACRRRREGQGRTEKEWEGQGREGNGRTDRNGSVPRDAQGDEQVLVKLEPHGVVGL
ncbi:hypothetical protein GCM10018952_69660 [Streptosporangium vulgare]